jgi:UDP-4-amino-4,6-dideoxy-N-acetyl-beta-L-altrosamine N-acetyltransferase
MNGLRDIQASDKDMLRRWRNLPEVANYMFTDHEISAEEHERWFHSIFGDPTSRYWIITSDDEDVGVANICGIDPQNRRCFWGFYLSSPNVRGKGVGAYVEYFVLRYVFEELGLNRLCGEVLATNDKVVQMHKGFGFKQEGYYRQHVLKGGKPLDVVAIAMLREEWQAQKPEIEERLRRKGLL